MSEREPIICNAITGAGCLQHEGFGMCDGSECRGGLWENRTIAPHIIRIEPCNGQGLAPQPETELSDEEHSS